MKHLITLVAAALFLSAAAVTASAQSAKIVISVEHVRPPKDGRPPFDGKRPAVDVALLLDTSNSMDGLISQAKRQLWTIVGQFAKAKKGGQTPVLRVALFEYGNSNLPASEGYIRQVVPLIDDLDKLSEALFALSTNGGDEYCGQVIDETITRLDWSKEPGGYRAIFIAGNEPFTQGPRDYKAACKRAIEHGIVINTIHCGEQRTGVDGKWQHGAQLAEGKSFNIDQDRVIAHIKAPQDEIIIRLNSELNGTYLWFGAKNAREGYADNQVAQDNNADRSGRGASVSRTIAKANSVYFNTNRDLVDTLKEDREILKKVKEEELPEQLQKMPARERETHIVAMGAKRSELQKKINALAAERDAYVAAQQRAATATGGDTTLGDAIASAIQGQLATYGFETASVGN